MSKPEYTFNYGAADAFMAIFGFTRWTMDKIVNREIRSQAKALQMIHKFSDYEFTERAGKFEHDAGFDKEVAERMALDEIRRKYARN